jgi:hypothetical protein
MNHAIFITNEGIKVNLGILKLAIFSAKARSQNVIVDEVNVIGAEMEGHFDKQLPWICNQQRENCIGNSSPGSQVPSIYTGQTTHRLHD